MANKSNITSMILSPPNRIKLNNLAECLGMSRNAVMNYLIENTEIGEVMIIRHVPIVKLQVKSAGYEDLQQTM